MALVVGEAQAQIGVDRVEALILERISAQLVDQADAAPLLAQIEQDSPARRGDRLERRVELRAAIAFERAEHVAGQAFAVEPDERRATGRRRRSAERHARRRRRRSERRRSRPARRSGSEASRARRSCSEVACSNASTSAAARDTPSSPASPSRNKAGSRPARRDKAMAAPAARSQPRRDGRGTGPSADWRGRAPDRRRPSPAARLDRASARSGPGRWGRPRAGWRASGSPRGGRR